MSVQDASTQTKNSVKMRIRGSVSKMAKGSMVYLSTFLSMNTSSNPVHYVELIRVTENALSIIRIVKIK